MYWGVNIFQELSEEFLMCAENHSYGYSLKGRFRRRSYKKLQPKTIEELPIYEDNLDDACCRGGGGG